MQSTVSRTYTVRNTTSIEATDRFEHDLDDRELVRRLATGDEEALAKLFRAHGSSLLGFLRRILGGDADAEDLLQETFLQAWRQSQNYRPESGSPRAWLFAIARSRAIDRIRSRLAATKREARFHQEDFTSRLQRGTPAHQALEARSLRGTLGAALYRLPARQADCLRLSFVEGLSHHEIAVRLDTPLGTVKSRILFGLKRLRAQLETLKAA